jgi:phosphonate transport system ATP-binding protein
MLEISNLRKDFGDTRALDDVSLAVARGEMVGVIGRSGAGKSTLLRTLNRLTEPTSGTVRFDGRDILGLQGRELRIWRRRCAMIFQQFNLVARLDVLTNALLGRLSFQSTPRSLLRMFTARERAFAFLTLQRVEMTRHVLQRADTLSGGQQQRVAIARALVQEPDMLLADEPIASLDPRSAGRVMDILRAINTEDGITVLCNLHTLDTARRYCDRIVGMRAGRIVYDGAPSGLCPAAVREIYGIEDGEEVDESVTSTAIQSEESAAATRPGLRGTAAGRAARPIRQAQR